MASLRVDPAWLFVIGARLRVGRCLVGRGVERGRADVRLLHADTNGVPFAHLD